MDRVRLGSAFRAIRLELSLRQSDVAGRAGVCQQTISKIERGRFGALSTDQLIAVADAIEADLSLSLQWRGPKLARLLDRRHAALQDRVVGLLADAGWIVSVEESFNHFGDRGSVDVLGWRPEDRALLLVEVKTEIVDLQNMLATMAMKARLVPKVIGRPRGWDVGPVASVLVLPEGHVHRRAVAQHAALLAAALPARTVAVRQWLAHPATALRGIWFLPNTLPRGANQPDPPLRRVSSRQRASRAAQTASQPRKRAISGS